MYICKVTTAYGLDIQIQNIKYNIVISHAAQYYTDFIMYS